MNAPMPAKTAEPIAKSGAPVCAVRPRRSCRNGLRSLLWRSLLLTILLLCSCQLIAQIPQSALLLPTSVAFDTEGNLFFTDANRHQVFEQTLAGTLRVVAGSGVQGFSGDGGQALTAYLDRPQGVAVGSDGTLYIADTGNARVRAVSGGQISTYAGSGERGFGGDGGPAAQAKFAEPTAIVVDAAGALLVADSGNHRVRRISGGIATTFAGDGSQGFSGDGGPATAAQLDTPQGLAVAADRSVFVADTHNNRVRVIAPDGTIRTVAGSGVQGFAGDGGSAQSAKLFKPKGVAVTPDGQLLIADSGNHRIRRVDASGVISTQAGNGLQGAAADGGLALSAPLNGLRFVAVSPLGMVFFADAGNGALRALSPNGQLYLPAALAGHRTSTVAVDASTSTYGSSTVHVRVAGSAGEARGRVSLSESGVAVGTAVLDHGAADAAVVPSNAGTHSITAAYEGDLLNPAATSPAATVVVLPRTLVAAANDVTISYGQTMPALTGTLTGVLAKDSGQVTVAFSTTALDLAPAGSYPISATLQGSARANYTLMLASTSGSLQIVPVASKTTAAGQSTYAGLPLSMSAAVASTTRGLPTGTVNFFEGSALVGSATLNGGVASATYLAASAGTHVVTASYNGDKNFLPSVSSQTSLSVAAMPDFTVTGIGSASQTVSAGSAAQYAITVVAQPAPFTGDVVMSVAGLPAGAKATFSPSEGVPGPAALQITLTVQTPVSKAALKEKHGCAWSLAAALGFCCLLGSRKRVLLPVACMSVCLLAALGCGARNAPSSASSRQSYLLTVTGTSTNLAGQVVSHSTALTLVVE